MTGTMQIPGSDVWKELDHTSDDVDLLCRKTKELFDRPARIFKSIWGLEYKSMRTICKGVFVSIITYATSALFDRTIKHQRTKLNSAKICIDGNLRGIQNYIRRKLYHNTIWSNNTTKGPKLGRWRKRKKNILERSKQENLERSHQAMAN